MPQDGRWCGVTRELNGYLGVGSQPGMEHGETSEGDTER